MVQCNNLSLILRGEKVLREISLKIEDGEFVALVGPPGSGKSRLIDVLAGLLKPTSGSVAYTGGNISIIPHEPYNLSDTLLEYAMSSRSKGFTLFQRYSQEDRSTAMRILSFLNLDRLQEKTLEELSRSHLAKTILARSLIADASYYFLDNGVDMLGIGAEVEVSRTIAWMLREGDKSLLLATNNINFALQHSDRILFMKEGSIVKDCSPYEVHGELINNIFNIDALVSKNIYNGRPEIHLFPAH